MTQKLELVMSSLRYLVEKDTNIKNLKVSAEES